MVKKNLILWNKYKDVDFPFDEIKSPDFEMKQYWDKIELIKYIKTWSAYKRFVEENNEDIESNFINHVQELWPDNQKKKVVMDFSVYVGKKRITIT